MVMWPWRDYCRERGKSEVVTPCAPENRDAELLRVAEGALLDIVSDETEGRDRAQEAIERIRKARS